MSSWVFAFCVWASQEVNSQRHVIFHDPLTTSYDAGWSSSGNFYGTYDGSMCYYRAGSTKNCTALFGTTSSSEITTFEHSFSDMGEYHDMKVQFDLVISSMIPGYPAGGIVICGVAYKYGANASWQQLGESYVLPSPITYGSAAFGGSNRSIPDPTEGESTLYFRFYTDPTTTSNAACFANNFYLTGYNASQTSSTTGSPTTTSSSSSAGFLGLDMLEMGVVALFAVFFVLLCCVGTTVICIRKRRKSKQGETLALVDTSRSANY